MTFMLLKFHIKGINYIKCKTVFNFIWPAYDNSDNKLNIQVWHSLENDNPYIIIMHTFLGLTVRNECFYIDDLYWIYKNIKMAVINTRVNILIE